ncbi:MAG: flippase-like domain-containing protein [Planctomycetes bacterium]|nr:flippase-like domain-containing protein [Planctomycetota bacterium]
MKIATAVAIVASVAVFLLPAAMTLMEQLSGRFADFRWMSLGIAIGLALIYWPASAYGWNLVLGALGHALPTRTAIRIWVSTQTCRWLPGGVWHYSSRTLQAISQGVPSTVAVASMGLELLLTIAAWGVVGVMGMAWYGNRQFQVERIFSAGTIEVILSGVLLLILFGAAVWLSARWFPQKLLAMRERLVSLRAVRPRAIPTIMSFLVYIALAMLNGLTFYAVIDAVSPDHHVPLLAAISINALAWVVGLLAIMAPGGLVVREAALALQLGLWMPPAEAVLIAVLWRLVQMAVEVVCVTGSYVPQSLGARLARRLRPAEPWNGLSTLETKSTK